MSKRRNRRNRHRLVSTITIHSKGHDYPYRGYRMGNWFATIDNPGFTVKHARSGIIIYPIRDEDLNTKGYNPLRGYYGFKFFKGDSPKKVALRMLKMLQGADLPFDSMEESERMENKDFNRARDLICDKLGFKRYSPNDSLS